MQQGRILGQALDASDDEHAEVIAAARYNHLVQTSAADDVQVRGLSACFTCKCFVTCHQHMYVCMSAAFTGCGEPYNHHHSGKATCP
jgi:hypothetical protein